MPTLRGTEPEVRYRGAAERGAGRERGGRRGEEGERGSDLFIAEQHPRPRPLGACTAMHVSKRSKRRRLGAQDLTRHSYHSIRAFHSVKAPLNPAHLLDRAR